MFGYDELEDDVAEYLAAIVPEPVAGQPISVLVEVLPNTDSSQRANVATRATIFAQGSTYSPNAGMGNVEQSGDARLFIEIEGKKRRGDGSVRAIAGAITGLLLGKQFPNFEKLELVEDQTQQLNGGIWFHQVIFRARRTMVEIPVDVAEPILKQVTVDVDTSEGQLIYGEIEDE